MTCETRCHKKLGFHHLFRRYIFGKTTGGGDQIDPPAFLGLVNRTCGFRINPYLFLFKLKLKKVFAGKMCYSHD